MVSWSARYGQLSSHIHDILVINFIDVREYIMVSHNLTILMLQYWTIKHRKPGNFTTVTIGFRQQLQFDAAWLGGVTSHLLGYFRRNFGSLREKGHILTWNILKSQDSSKWDSKAYNRRKLDKYCLFWYHTPYMGYLAL